MAILIKSKRVEGKIRELAAETGDSLTEAVEKAVDARLATVPPKRKGRVDHAGLAKLLAEIDSLPRMNEHLTDDEILGYNHEGHFD
jgi:antitoxin VapB